MKRVHVVLVVLLTLAPFATAADPDPALYWFSDLLPSLAPPPGPVVVLIMVPGYVPDADPLSGPALAVSGIAEATDYWTWTFTHGTGAYPQFAGITLTARVLGVDASPEDVERAMITVNVADAEPTLAGTQLAFALQDPLAPVRGASHCTIGIDSLGDYPEAVEGMQVRNLALHEIGHCLGLGHTGISGGSHCNANGTCYDGHPTDLMSVLDVEGRQCVSNLNLHGLGEAYAWRTSPTAEWGPNDGETYLLKSEYAQTCMPASLERF